MVYLCSFPQFFKSQVHLLSFKETLLSKEDNYQVYAILCWFFIIQTYKQLLAIQEVLPTL